MTGPLVDCSTCETVMSSTPFETLVTVVVCASAIIDETSIETGPFKIPGDVCLSRVHQSSIIILEGLHEYTGRFSGDLVLRHSSLQTPFRLSGRSVI